MSTIYQQALKGVVTEWMQDRPQAGVLVDYLQKMQSGFWDAWYMDFFLQKGGWMNDAYSLEDAYAFMMLHCRLGIGDIAVCDIPVGFTPGPDADIDNNLKKLKGGLSGLVCQFGTAVPPVFDVDLWGGTQDEDGVISWNPYLEFEVFADGKSHHTVWVESENIPLEVGSQAGCKTLMQLTQWGALARWPYGSKTIRMFKVVNPWYSDFP